MQQLLYDRVGLSAAQSPLDGWPNPLQSFQDICQILQEPSQTVWMAPIHGDLNLDNVQTDGTRLWLIDFAHTRRGPIVYDFAKAEVELRVTLFDKLQAEAKVGGLEQYFTFENTLPEPANDTPVRSDKVGSLIALIRQCALKYCQTPPWDYYLALLVYSLASLKFSHARDKGTAPMLVASATVAAQKALQYLKDNIA